MRITRGQNRTAVDFIKDKLLIDEGQTQDQVATWLSKIIEEDRDSLLLLIAVDEPAIGDVKLLAFLIGLAVEGKDYTFLYQAWAEPSCEGWITRHGFNGMVKWTETLGRRYIRMETKREVDPFTRKWGFEEISKICQYDTQKEDEVLKIATPTKEEVSNGNVEQTTASGQSEQRADESQEAVSRSDT